MVPFRADPSCIICHEAVPTQAVCSLNHFKTHPDTATSTLCQECFNKNPSFFLRRDCDCCFKPLVLQWREYLPYASKDIYYLFAVLAKTVLIGAGMTAAGSALFGNGKEQIHKDTIAGLQRSLMPAVFLTAIKAIKTFGLSQNKEVAFLLTLSSLRVWNPALFNRILQMGLTDRNLSGGGELGYVCFALGILMHHLKFVIQPARG